MNVMGSTGSLLVKSSYLQVYGQWNGSRSIQEVDDFSIKSELGPPHN